MMGAILCGHDLGRAVRCRMAWKEGKEEEEFEFAVQRGLFVEIVKTFGNSRPE
jgi:hypothetical protein